MSSSPYSIDTKQKDEKKDRNAPVPKRHATHQPDHHYQSETVLSEYEQEGLEGEVQHPEEKRVPCVQEGRTVAGHELYARRDIEW